MKKIQINVQLSLFVGAEDDLSVDSIMDRICIDPFSDDECVEVLSCEVESFNKA